MKVLVTGASGQLARSLVERASIGLEILALGRPDLDLEIPGSAERAIAAAAPELVINAAAYTAVDQAEDEPDRAWRINADGAGEVAAAAARCGARFLHISTDYVFDGRTERPYREDDKPNPLGVYGRTKLAGEEAVRAVNPDSVIVRTAWVFSPFGRNFVKTIASAACSRDALDVVDDQHGNPTSAFNLADALLRIVETRRTSRMIGTGETYHVAGTGLTSWCGFAREIMAECRKLELETAEIRPIATDDWPTKAVRPRNSALDSGKFERDYGFAMPHWRDSLATVMQRLAAGS